MFMAGTASENDGLSAELDTASAALDEAQLNADGEQGGTTSFEKSALFFIVGSLLLLSIGMRFRGAARTPSNVKAASHSATRKSNSPPETSVSGQLDALIHNSLPITEEPCRIPQGLTFFGATPGPARLRIDAAHEVSGPRFQSNKQAQAAAEASSDTVSATKSNTKIRVERPHGSQPVSFATQSASETPLSTEQHGSRAKYQDRDPKHSLGSGTHQSTTDAPAENSTEERVSTGSSKQEFPRVNDGQPELLVRALSRIQGAPAR
jgi:hypothetical protein